jgi:hypothetical protein
LLHPTPPPASPFHSSPIPSPPLPLPLTPPTHTLLDHPSSSISSLFAPFLLPLCARLPPTTAEVRLCNQQRIQRQQRPAFFLSTFMCCWTT